MNTVEQWNPVAGYEEYYEVSNAGRVRSIARSHTATHPITGKPCEFFRKQAMLKTQVRKDGYEQVRLSKGTPKTALVHRLVLESFVGPRPQGMVSCHNDGNRINNRLSNLRWDTQKSNANDSLKHGTRRLGERHQNSKLNDAIVKELRKISLYGIAASELAAQVGVAPATVRTVVRGGTWRHV